MGGSMSEHQETLAEKDASKKADLNERKCDSSPLGLRELISDHRHLLDELGATEEKHERTEIIQKLYASLDKVLDCVKDETSPKQRRKQSKDESDSSTMDTGSLVDYHLVPESEVDSKNQAEENADKRFRMEEQKHDCCTEEFHLLLHIQITLVEKMETTEDKDERTQIRKDFRGVLEKVHDCMKNQRIQGKKTEKQGKGESNSSAMDTGSRIDEGPVSRKWSIFGKKPTKLPSLTFSVMKPIDCDLKGADSAFLNACQKQLCKSVKLTIKLENVAAHGKAGGFNVLICPIVDRLGSSVDSAMRKAECAGHLRLVLVLFHHQAPHLALPMESDRLLTDDPYNRTGCMVDVVFWQNEGMYDCDSNTRAVDKLVRFIQNSLAE